MANSRKPGKNEIKSGERDIAKGILGRRDYDIAVGTDKIIKGEMRKREYKRGPKKVRR